MNNPDRQHGIGKWLKEQYHKRYGETSDERVLNISFDIACSLGATVVLGFIGVVVGAHFGNPDLGAFVGGGAGAGVSEVALPRFRRFVRRTLQ